MYFLVACLSSYILISRRCGVAATVECAINGDALCRVDHADGPTWSPDDARVAPFVVNATGCLYHDSVLMQDRVLLQWSQKLSDLQDGYVHGYSVTLYRRNPVGDPNYYNFDISALKSFWSDMDTSIVTFRFNCCHEYADIRAGNTYAFLPSPNPMYRAEDNPDDRQPYPISQSCSQHTSKAKHVSKSRRRRKERAGRKKAKGRKRFREKLPVVEQDVAQIDAMPGDFWSAGGVYIALAISCGILTVLFVATIILLYQRTRSMKMIKNDSDRPSCEQIVIISSAGPFLHSVNKFITILHKIKGIKTVSNIRQEVKIGNSGMMNWADKNISNSSVVIFMVTRTSDLAADTRDAEETSNMQVAVAVRVAENHFAAGDSGDRKFIAIDLAGCLRDSELKFCKHYKLPDDLDHVLRQVHQKHQQYVSSEDKKAFTTILKNIQAQYRASEMVAERTVVEQNALNICGGQRSMLYQNDLDADSDASNTAEHCTLNIVQEYSTPAHSLLSSYVTNDFNV